VSSDGQFLAQVTSTVVEQVRAELRNAPKGRGSSFVGLADAVCVELLQRVGEEVGKLPGADEAAAARVQRELQRLRMGAEVAHFHVSALTGGVARRDLPVGLLHLVDELVRDLLDSSADPLIHLMDERMYSTFPVFEDFRPHVKSVACPDPQPIVFNLPGVDPTNVLLSPILAHEVGHTAWSQGVQKAFLSQADLAAAKAPLLRAAHATGTDEKLIARTFIFRVTEHMCDALATVLTGPSFAFASAVFLPLVSGRQRWNRNGRPTHPLPQDRMALHLHMLDQLGWSDLLAQRIPKIHTWLQGHAQNPQLSKDPVEDALRDAVEAIQQSIIDVAIASVTNGASSAEYSTMEGELQSLLKVGIPPAEVAGKAVSPWLIVLAGWMSELQDLHDEPTRLSHVMADDHVNRFLLKSVELSAVASLWGEVA